MNKHIDSSDNIYEVRPKRRPERKREINESQITFTTIDRQHKAQIALRSQHVSFRVSGLSLYVRDSQEFMALGILGKAGIKIVEPIWMETDEFIPDIHPISRASV